MAKFTRFFALLLSIMNFIVFIILPIQIMNTGWLDPYSLHYDLALGISFQFLFLVIVKGDHKKYLFVFSALELVYWWTFLADRILGMNKFIWEIFPTIFLTYGFGILLVLIVLFTFLFGILPWLFVAHEGKGIGFIQNSKQFLSEISGKLKINTLKSKILLILILGAVPGILMNIPSVYEPTITIEPKDYDIQYKWWAHRSNISEYDDAVLDELNQHHSILDLVLRMFDDSGDVIPASEQCLHEWESRCPNNTYRLVMFGNNLTHILERSKKTIDYFIDAENSGNSSALNQNGQWLGLTWDVENPTFETYNWFATTTDNIAAWEEFFDYAYAVMARENRLIELESVHSSRQMNDWKDGDADLQTIDGYFSVSQDQGFTVYAPMIYRGENRDPIPYGVNEDNSVYDPTHMNSEYEFYSNIYETVNHLPISMRGAYIGITNVTCYGRDLLQDQETTDWFTDFEDPGVATGFGNFIRDVLIMKHFEIPVVTIFLLQSAADDANTEYAGYPGHIMGDPFESYGIDFLDVLNETVNTHPPESFTIRAKVSENEGIEPFRYDWWLDTSRPLGFTYFILLFILTGIIYHTWLSNNLAKKEKQNTNEK